MGLVQAKVFRRRNLVADGRRSVVERPLFFEVFADCLAEVESLALAARLNETVPRLFDLERNAGAEDGLFCGSNGFHRSIHLIDRPWKIKVAVSARL